MPEAGKRDGSEHSFGIHVAQMAGIAQSGWCCGRQRIMKYLEKDKQLQQHQEKMKDMPKKQDYSCGC